MEQASNKRPVSVSTVNQAHSDTSLLGVYVSCNGAYAEPTVRAAWSGLKKLASEGPSKEQLVAAQKAATLDALLHLEQPSHMALDQAHYVLANGELTSYEDFVQHISKVSADDVKKVCPHPLNLFISRIARCRRQRRLSTNRRWLPTVASIKCRTLISSNRRSPHN